MFNRFGTVSHGTIKSSDLIPTFIEELEQLNGGTIDLVDDFVCTLIDRLNDDLPPFVYFGAHPGDSSDFGYWFDSDSFEQAVQYGEVLKTDELPDVFPDGFDYVAVISDHGNITLYDCNLEEIYGIV